MLKIKTHPFRFTFLAVIAIYVSGLMSQVIYSIMNTNNPDKKHFSFGIRAFTECITSIRGMFCLLITIIVMYFIWRKLIKPRQEIKTGIDDERKFTYAATGEYGTASAMTENDLKDILEFKSIEETDGIILGETYDGKVVSIPTQAEFDEKAKRNKWTQDDKTNNTRNRNMLVIGSPGTMKSRAIIMNQIFQACKIGDSIICTDPKGELYEKTYKILTSHGYDVKMFNLVQQKYSDAWNPLIELSSESYIKEAMNDVARASRMKRDSTYAKIFAETVVNNAKGDSKGEQFWDDNAMNFFKAALMSNNSETLGALYDFISGKSLEQFNTEFMSTEEESVARRAYNIFNQSSDVVKAQIINGLGIMIDVFQDQTIRDITNTSELDMTKPAREKCAYFVITSDQHRTFDYLAVLFWTMAFIKLVEYIDANKDEGGATTKPVHLLLDEFPNIGAIPDFNRKLSTVRSRLLYSTIVIQNLPQLMNRYPNGMHEEIFSDCDFTVFLGCNDVLTAKYISELTGTATINVETVNHIYEGNQLVLNQHQEYRKVKSVGQRTVMNMDEVKSIKNTDLLLFIRGTKSVYQCKKFDYSKHPYAKEIEYYKVREHVPQWKKDKLEKIKSEQERIEKQKRQEEEDAKKQKEIYENAARQKEEKKQMDKELIDKEYQETIGNGMKPMDQEAIQTSLYGEIKTDSNDNDVNKQQNRRTEKKNKESNKNKENNKTNENQTSLFGDNYQRKKQGKNSDAKPAVMSLNTATQTINLNANDYDVDEPIEIEEEMVDKIKPTQKNSQKNKGTNSTFNGFDF